MEWNGMNGYSLGQERTFAFLLWVMIALVAQQGLSYCFLYSARSFSPFPKMIRPFHWVFFLFILDDDACHCVSFSFS